MMLLNSKQILYFYEWLKIYVRVQGYVKLNSSCSVVTKMYTLYSSLPKNTIFRVYKSAFKSYGPIYTISSHLFVCILYHFFCTVQSVLTQNGTPERTPFSGIVFHANYAQFLPTRDRNLIYRVNNPI